MGGIETIGKDEIGAFSSTDSLTEGINLIYKRMGLIIPFIFSGIIGILFTSIIAATFYGSPTTLRVTAYSGPIGFLSHVVSYLIASWGTWLVIRRYRRQGIANIPEDPDLEIDGFTNFLSRRNPLLGSLLGLALVFASIYTAQSLLSTLLTVFDASSTLASIALSVVFWIISLVLGFSIFGVLLGRLSTVEAMRLSRRIVSSNIAVTVGLWLGLWVVVWVISWVFGWILIPILSLASGVMPGPGHVGGYILSQRIGMSIAGGISGAIRMSCLCFAFLSTFGKMDKVSLAVVHGKVLPECPGSPELPVCEQCRELQDYGDRYFCTRFRVTIMKAPDKR